MDRLKPSDKLSRREFLKLILFFVKGIIIYLLGGCDRSDGGDVMAHPTPSSAEISWPEDAVLLFDQPGQRIKVGTIELYQNGSKDFSYDPFEVYVSPNAFKNFVLELKKEDIVKEEDNNIRFVYHFPGNPEGSELLCQGNQTRIIMLEMGRAIYEHVYQAHFQGKNLNDPEVLNKFLAEAQNQVNLVLFHEAQHIKHCREGWQDKGKAEQDAIAAENRRILTLSPVFFLKLKPNTNLNDAMRYIEKLIEKR